MKAEQRKELETNALADRMGHLVQRARTQPRRSSLYWTLAVVAVALILFSVVRYFQLQRAETSKEWMFLDFGTRQALGELLKSADTNPGKSARFEYAWLLYWEAGVKRLGIGNASEGMAALEKAGELYTQLAKDCADDPVWEPEALYGLAAIEETRTVAAPSHLEAAKARYEELAKKYPKSARGQLAADWVAKYDDATQRNEMVQFYQEMRTALNIPDPNMLPKKGLDLEKAIKAMKQPK